MEGKRLPKMALSQSRDGNPDRSLEVGTDKATHFKFDHGECQDKLP